MALIAAVAVAGPACKRLKKLTGLDKKSSDTAVIKIISPHWEGIRKETAGAFEAWYKKKHGKDITVEWVEQGGGSSELMYIRDSFKKKPDGIGIDIFYGGGSDRYVELAGAGLLAPCEIDPALLEEIPQTLNGTPLYDENHLWYGVSIGSFGILINKEILEAQNLPEPAAWADLAWPEMAGWVEIADPRKSSSSHAVFEILLQHYGWDRGWDILTRIGAGARALPESSSQVPRDTAMGQIAYGLTLVSYGFSHIEEYGADKLAFVLPDDATAVTPDPIAVLKGAPNAEAACEFVRFSLSPEGQKLWLLKRGAPGGPKEFSLNKMVVLPSAYEGLGGNSLLKLNPYEMDQAIDYDAEKGALRVNIVDELAGALMVDTHEDLAAGWKKSGNSTPEGFFNPPISEDDAAKLAAGDWNDPLKRDKIIAGWKKAARAKYKGM